MKRLNILFLSGLAVILAAMCNNKIVPLYDGVGFPDEPYRYVKKSPDLPPTAPPTEAHGTSTVKNSLNNQLLYPSSQEQGPQISLFLPRNAIKTGASATKIDLYAKPIAPDSQPGNGVIAGNIYRISATSDSEEVLPNGDATIGTISLRLPKGEAAGPIMEYRPAPNAHWRILKTNQVGTDVYQSELQGLGDFVLVEPTSAKNSNPNYTLAYILAGLATAVGAIIFLLRLNGAKKSPRQ